MASINIQIWDATSGKLQEVELPDNAPVNRIIPVLLDKMNLPKNGSDGQPLDYKLYLEANGVQLLGTQCLADVGVKDGTVIRLQPLSINSKPLHNKGTNLIPKLWIGGIAIVAIIAIFIVRYYPSDNKNKDSGDAQIRQDEDRRRKEEERLRQEAYKRAIESVLRQNKNINSGRIDNLNDVSYRIQCMHSINLSECPDNFKHAYRKYMAAMDEMLKVLRKADARESEFWGEFWGTLFVSAVTEQWYLMIGPGLSAINVDDKNKKEIQQAGDEIKNMYYQVLHVAQKYKVDTTPYAN